MNIYIYGSEARKRGVSVVEAVGLTPAAWMSAKATGVLESGQWADLREKKAQGSKENSAKEEKTVEEMASGKWVADAWPSTVIRPDRPAPLFRNQYGEIGGLAPIRP